MTSKGFLAIKTKVERVIKLARQDSGNEMGDINNDIVQHLKGVELVNEELQNLIKSFMSEDEKLASKAEPQKWTLEKMSKVFGKIQTAKDKMKNSEPSIKCSIKVLCLMSEAMILLQVHNELKRKKETTTNYKVLPD